MHIHIFIYPTQNLQTKCILSHPSNVLWIHINNYILHLEHHKQESSAKLTNQRVSYAFTSSPFSFHARHILPTSKFQHSYSCILLIFYNLQASVKSMCENCECKTVNTVHWFDASCLVIPLNNTITLISPVQSLAGLHFCRWQYMRSSANFRTVFPESQKASSLHAELGPDFNAKWQFRVIQGHPFRRQWRATKGLHSTI